MPVTALSSPGPPDPADGELRLTGGCDLPKGTQLRGRAGNA